MSLEKKLLNELQETMLFYYDTINKFANLKDRRLDSLCLLLIFVIYEAKTKYGVKLSQVNIPLTTTALSVGWAVSTFQTVSHWCVCVFLLFYMSVMVLQDKYYGIHICYTQSDFRY